MKDLMIAMNLVPGPRKLSNQDTNFLPIAESMRRLRPVCNPLATASAGNNETGKHDIEEAVVHIVKDCARKLFNTVKTQGARPGQLGVLFAQMMVLEILL